MIELIFVIIIMGILAKFGVEFLAQAYNSFIFSKINHELQSNSEATVEFIAKRLEGRIKDSVIARQADNSFDAIGDVNNSKTYVALEWIGSDTDGFRGTSDASDTPYLPNWSGIIDLDESNATILVSPKTNTTKENQLIQTLSNNASDINDSALYFIGSNSDIKTGYGWDGNLTAIKAQNGAMHPINSDTNTTIFKPAYPTDGNFTDVYEYYKLAWSGYAVVMEDYNATTKMGNLYFYHNYQPWKGERFNDNNDSSHKSLLMKNVSTFRFTSIGSIMKIQVCTKSNLIEDEKYSLCKEKTIF